MLLNLKERIKFLAENKFCYACLQLMSDTHNVKSCEWKLSCSSCSGNHPTPLFGYVPKSKRDKSDGSKDGTKQEDLKNNFARLDGVKCTFATGKSIKSHQHVHFSCENSVWR